MKTMLCKCIAVCAILALILSATGCFQKQTEIPLTETEIAEANQAFLDSEMCCFFTCYYDDPQEIDLTAFLRYCPVGVMLEDADTEEFMAWKEAAQWPDPDGIYHKPSEFYVPVRRLANADVSAILEKYTGISTADINSIGDYVYLEEYDAFYNYTSDAAPGYFESVGGTKEGSVVRLWSETAEDGTRTVLTLEQAGDRYLIHSFMQERVD